MAMAVFNIALGRGAYYGGLPAANDALIVIPLATAGLPSDATLKDCATVAAVLAAATEQTSMGRKTLANVTVTVDNTNDRVNVDADDAIWSSTSGAAVGAFIIAYDPDTTTSTDSTRIPLVKSDATLTPDGNPFTLGIADFYRAA
jgi:hypothetical protein